MSIIHYKIYCETDARWEKWLLDGDDPAPTACPVDTGHAVTSDSVSVVETVGPNDVNVVSQSPVEVSNQPVSRDDGVTYAVPKAASFGLEMCDRDFKLVCSTFDAKAMTTVLGADANGHVIFQAARAGMVGNMVSIEVKVGDTGVGFESRALAASRAGFNVVITFGTDSNGDSVVPTALSVANTVNADLNISQYFVQAVPNGTGASDAGVTAPVNLAGGTTISHEDLKVNPQTLKEEGWCELFLFGVYKDDGAGNMTPCVDAADATANAILSAWDYVALHQQTHDLMKYEIRDGFLIVDNTIDQVNERWDHRAYAVGAADIPAAYGGSIQLFDGYLGPAPGGVIDAQSPQTSVMDPSLGPGTSSIRLFIFYPKGSALKHVLRLVTYRAPGTF